MKTIKKQCSVVLLPTEDYKNKDRTVVTLSNIPTEIKNYFLPQNYHLYVLSDEDIKDDWYYHTNLKQIFHRNNSHIDWLASRKVIATTDTSLVPNKPNGQTFTKLLPKPTDEFIQQFVSKGCPEKIEVEYESKFIDEKGNKAERLNGNSQHIISLKINQDNTINCSFIEDGWDVFFEKMNKTFDNLDFSTAGNYIAAIKKYVKREKYSPPVKK